MLVLAENIQIPFNEMSFSFARSSGPGGQNVNKVNTKALLRWNPAQSPSIPDDLRARFLSRYGNRLTKSGDILLVSDRFRDRPRNQEDCVEKLRALLLDVLYPPKTRKKTRPSAASRERRKETKRKHGEKKKSRRKSSWT